MKKEKKRFVKMVTILCAAIFVLGCTTTVFAATDIIGRGTGGSSISSKTSNSSSKSSTASTTYSGQGSTTGTASAVTSGVATASTANVKGAISDPASVSKVSSVATGVTEKLMPILAVILAAVGVFWIFFHFQMNQVRYGKSEKYYKELLDFKVSCRM